MDNGQVREKPDYITMIKATAIAATPEGRSCCTTGNTIWKKVVLKDADHIFYLQSTRPSMCFGFVIDPG